VTTKKSPDRWLQPFGETLLADNDLAMAMQIPLLANLSAAGFPPNEPLSAILQHDARIRKFKPGDVVIRAGDYGHSIFFILQGSGTVILGHSPPLNRVRQAKRSWWQTLSFLWKNPQSREVRSEDQLQRAHFITRTRTSGSVQIVIADNDKWLAGKHTGTLYAGDMFGETAALIRSPRIATVIADKYLVALEMGRQGFLEILRYDSRFKQYIDGLYRARSLRSQLVRSPLFSHLSADVIDEITEHTLFRTYGRFEWHSSFGRQDQQEDSESDPIIVEQSASLEGLIIIQTGFARLSVQQDSNQRTIDYASNQELFGWEEIVAHWRDGAELVSRYRLTALGYTDILLVPTHLLIKYILPSVAAHLLPEHSSITFH